MSQAAGNSGGGERPTKPMSSGDGETGGGSSPHDETRRGRHQKNKGPQPGADKFKGKCEDLEGVIYDIAASQSNQDLYTTATKEIAEYVAREYDQAGEFRLGLINLKLPALTPLTAQDSDASLAGIEVYKMDLKEYRDKARKRVVIMAKLYALILGQRSQAIRDQIEAAQTWHGINQASDTLGLLGLIQRSLYTKATNQHMTVALEKLITT
ncbi:hypothetical protein ACA910_015565 [Epithemia clementina (nom. ined.)]